MSDDEYQPKKKEPCSSPPIGDRPLKLKSADARVLNSASAGYGTLGMMTHARNARDDDARTERSE